MNIEENKIIQRYIGGGMCILKVYKDYLSKSKNSIDAGANCGDISSYMAKYSNVVHSFEPNPEVFKKLYDRGLENVICYNMALSNESSTMKLLLPRDNALDGEINTGVASLSSEWISKIKLEYPNRFYNISSIDVNVRTIDSFNLTNISSIKVDVEGLELEVLLGAKETIKRERPSLLVEIWDNKKEQITNIITQIETTYDYTGYYYSNVENVILPWEVLHLSAERVVDFLFLPN